MRILDTQDSIVAISTSPGVGAIAVIRISGKESIDIVEKVFSKTLKDKDSHTIHFGVLKDDTSIVDEVVVALFKGDKSFTGENSIEISCHGSPYIQRKIVEVLIKNGARTAEPGEFSLRAFYNGKLDLSQTEAIADVIHSNSEASHKIAMNQMRGGFSKQINELREKLIHFASLIELELDFSEEDVEFADRQDLKDLIYEIQKILIKLIDSFQLGNAIKNGVPIAIIGKPNVGKSTLLNALLNEDRAIVSDIAGTTRDVVEDEVIIDGVNFRFIDTAGIRKTNDTIENLGIEKSFEQAKKAQVVLHLIDSTDTSEDSGVINEIDGRHNTILTIINKVDLIDENQLNSLRVRYKDAIEVSAKNDLNINELKQSLSSLVKLGELNQNDVVVSNIRHYEALSEAKSSLDQVLNGLDSNITGDFLAMDIRQSLFHLGSITGEISTDDLLDNIFSKFCIGK